jgi:hypothetical protein
MNRDKMESAALQTLLDCAEGQVKRLTDERENLTNERNALRADNDAQRGELREAKAERDTLRNRNNALHCELGESEAKRASLHYHCQIIEQRNTDQANMLKDVIGACGLTEMPFGKSPADVVREKIEELKRTSGNAKLRDAEAHQTIHRLERLNDALVFTRDHLEKRNDELQATINQQGDTILELTGQRDEARSRITSETGPGIRINLPGVYVAERKDSGLLGITRYAHRDAVVLTRDSLDDNNQPKFWKVFETGTGELQAYAPPADVQVRMGLVNDPLAGMRGPMVGQPGPNGVCECEGRVARLELWAKSAGYRIGNPFAFCDAIRRPADTDAAQRVLDRLIRLERFAEKIAPSTWSDTK